MAETSIDGQGPSWGSVTLPADSAAQAVALVALAGGSPEIPAADQPVDDRR